MSPVRPLCAPGPAQRPVLTRQGQACPVSLKTANYFNNNLQNKMSFLDYRFDIVVISMGLGLLLKNIGLDAGTGQLKWIIQRMEGTYT